jgi:hypothetical protein
VTCAFCSPRRNVGGVGHVTAGSVRSTSSGPDVSCALLPAASVAVPLTVCGCALSPNGSDVGLTWNVSDAESGVAARGRSRSCQ